MYRRLCRGPLLIPYSMLMLMLVVTSNVQAGSSQWKAEARGSNNIEVVAHLPLGAPLSVTDLDIEQEMSRPYAYVARANILADGQRGTDIIDLSDPEYPRVLHRWRIANQELHVGPGGMDVKHFKWNGRYYVVQSLQFGQGGPNSDVGAAVLDVTGLPDSSSVEEIALIRAPDHPGGFHNIFIYQHSNGRVLLFATVRGPYAHVYDLGHVVSGAMKNALVATVPVGKMKTGMGGYHDLYVGYHLDTEQDRFYGGGTGGYYVYDVTELENPQLMITLTGIDGVEWGHTFTPSPDGRYVIGETEYRYAPLRIFDLQPALDGEVQNIRQPISAWTADWRHLVHNHEVRWPFVFVSGYVDGLQIFSLADPHQPATVAYYDTFIGPLNDPTVFTPIFNGAFGVDVRNADGLIVVSDSTSGFWAFRMEGFSGWNGNNWGMPNVSSAQDWDRGPAESAQRRLKR